MGRINRRFKRINNRFERLLQCSFFGVRLDIYIAFLLMVIIGFWPISSGLLSLKNDEIIYFLPYRYNIVENLRNWQLPLWSPYIYMGFPVSGDMQSGAWNPVVWLLALTGRYTLTTLHAELLIYIFFAAIGMFKLMRALRYQTIVCFTIGISYAFSGFIIDSGQFICWESCACFLPYTYLYFIRILAKPGLYSGSKFAFANFCLLIAGGYPFFFIANIYFLTAAFLVFCFVAWHNRETPKIIKTFSILAFSALLFSLLSAAPVLCFINLLPYYSRGTQLLLKDALFNSYSLFSTISFLFPFSITRDNFHFVNTNVLSRNLYIGINLLPFALRGMFIKRTIAWNNILLFLLFSFVISLGDLLPLRTWAYWWLPLMNTFRHPSNFRLFITVALLTFAAKGLQHFLSEPFDGKKTIRHFYFIGFCMLLIGIWYVPISENNPFSKASLTTTGLKNILNNISFRQAVFLSLLVQLPFIFLAVLFLKRNKYHQLCMLSIANIIIIAQPQLLSSSVAKNSIFEFNKFIRSQPEGFPVASLSAAISFPDEKKKFLYEYKEPLKYFYNKKIAINTFINNPTILKTYSDFINDTNLLSVMKTYPIIYEADSFSSTIKKNQAEAVNYWLRSNDLNGRLQPNYNVAPLSFNANAYKFSVNTDINSSLVILQNNLPGWKASANGKEIPILTVNKTFMGFNLPAGNYTLQVQYKPGWLITGIILSIAGFFIMAIILFIGRKDPRISS